jgi:hypothetical protein
VSNLNTALATSEPISIVPTATSTSAKKETHLGTSSNVPPARGNLYAGRFDNVWTESEYDILRNNRTMKSRQLMALLPGRSEKAIASARERKNLRKAWLIDELDILKNNQHLPSWKLCELLPGRTKPSIQRHRVKLGWPFIRPKTKPPQSRKPKPQKPVKRKLIKAAGC